MFCIRQGWVIQLYAFVAIHRTVALEICAFHGKPITSIKVNVFLKKTNKP